MTHLTRTTEIGNGDAILATYNVEFDSYYLTTRWSNKVTELTSIEAKALYELFSQVNGFNKPKNDVNGNNNSLTK
jgi:hypothetical protein